MLYIPYHALHSKQRNSTVISSFRLGVILVILLSRHIFGVKLCFSPFTFPPLEKQKKQSFAVIFRVQNKAVRFQTNNLNRRSCVIKKNYSNIHFLSSSSLSVVFIYLIIKNCELAGGFQSKLFLLFYVIFSRHECDNRVTSSLNVNSRREGDEGEGTNSVAFIHSRGLEALRFVLFLSFCHSRRLGSC